MEQSIKALEKMSPWPPKSDKSDSKKIRTLIMTLCKYECMILSHDVSKILTACKMFQISIAQSQMKAKIHSFPTMYILGGVDVVEMGQIKVLVQKLGPG